MTRVQEVAVQCEECGETFVVIPDTGLFKTLFGHEVECPECGAWCEFTLNENTFERDD
ncbi:MAG: hypothetical protein AAB403_13115 [Planctomycetota bacterium]